MNPDRQIYILIKTSVNFLDNPANSFVRAILSYPNVHLKHFYVSEIAQRTPIERWIQNSTLFRSLSLNAHVSDVYRLIILWRYQGIYLDMDTLTLKSFDKIPENFACIENEKANKIGSAFMGVEGDVGKKFIEMSLK